MMLYIIFTDGKGYLPSEREEGIILAKWLPTSACYMLLSGCNLNMWQIHFHSVTVVFTEAREQHSWF